LSHLNESPGFLALRPLPRPLPDTAVLLPLFVRETTGPAGRADPLNFLPQTCPCIGDLAPW
jgi:hypothetical protein